MNKKIIIITLLIVCNIVTLFSLGNIYKEKNAMENVNKKHIGHMNDAWAQSMIDADFNIAFFGDSLTKNGNWNSYFSEKNIVNLGVSGDTMHRLIQRIPTLKATKPEVIFLCIGSNDIMRNDSKTYIINSYVNVLDELTKIPNVKIYVQGLIPVRKPCPRSNEDLHYVSEEIRTLAKKYNLEFIDLWPYMADSEDNLKKNFAKDDGLHLTEACYSQWKTILTNYIDSI